MKAIISLATLFFTALPLQRVLNVIGFVGIGILLLAGGIGLATDARAAKPLFAFTGIWFFLWIAFPAMFVQSFVASLVSAARSHQLLPYLRFRVLCALSCSILTMTLLVTAPLAALSSGQPHLSLILVASYAFTFMTLMTLLFMTRFGFVVVLLAVMLQADSGLAPWFSSHSVILNQAMPFVAISLWLVFCLWYLRARRVGLSIALNLPGVFSAAFDSSKYEFTQVSRAVAERVLLLGQSGLPRRFRIKNHPSGLKPQRLFAAAPMVVLLVWIFPGYGWGALAPLCPIALLAYANVLNLYARNTRRLWLHVADDRRLMFRRIEQTVWRYSGLLLGFILLVHCFDLHRIPQISVYQVCYAALLNISAIPFAIYLGLAATRGIGIATLVVAAGFAGGMAFAIAKTNVMEPAWFAFGSTLLLITAVGLRGIAIHRWRSIDWRSFRPVSIAQLPNLRPTTPRVANPWQTTP